MFTVASTHQTGGKKKKKKKKKETVIQIQMYPVPAAVSETGDI